jgi:hypothetical protein
MSLELSNHCRDAIQCYIAEALRKNGKISREVGASADAKHILRCTNGECSR